MNMGGVGKDDSKGMTSVGSLVKPVADVAQKAATAGKIKSIKLKVKMKGSK